MSRISASLVTACLLGAACAVQAGEPVQVESRFKADLDGLKETHSFSMVQVTVAAGTREPAHTHPGDEILYVISGTGAVYVDGVRHALQPGAVVHVRRGQRKALSSEGTAEPLQVLACLILEKGLAPIERVDAR